MADRSTSVALNNVLASDAEQTSNISTVAVGDPNTWFAQGNQLPTENIAFIAFEDVTEEFFERVKPKAVFSPVLASGFDCIELAVTLRNIGFSGSYRALSSNLPKPELIEREVSQMCPRIDFAILMTH
jgi:hypothetical protein